LGRRLAGKVCWTAFGGSNGSSSSRRGLPRLQLVLLLLLWGLLQRRLKRLHWWGRTSAATLGPCCYCCYAFW
jgi:hypothetical protein